MEDLDKHWQCFNEKCSQRDRCVPCRANLKNVKQLIYEREREARLSELEKTHQYIDDTVMFLTNDLPSLLEQDRVFEIRKHHKNELHDNIDDRIKQLKKEG